MCVSIRSRLHLQHQQRPQAGPSVVMQTPTPVIGPSVLLDLRRSYLCRRGGGGVIQNKSLSRGATLEQRFAKPSRWLQSSLKESAEAAMWAEQTPPRLHAHVILGKVSEQSAYSCKRNLLMLKKKRTDCSHVIPVMVVSPVHVLLSRPLFLVFFHISF